MELVLKSDSEERSLSLGVAIGAALSPGDLVCLEGELGTGKTVLVRGIARGRGYHGPVTSPTFTIIHAYPEALLCHVDAFRLRSAHELLDAGIEEYLDDWTCAVEWALNVRGALPSEVLEVALEFGDGEDERLIVLEGTGRYERLVGLVEERAHG